MKIQLILEINVPDGIGTYEDALEYLQYEIGFGANACSCEIHLCCTTKKFHTMWYLMKIVKLTIKGNINT